MRISSLTYSPELTKATHVAPSSVVKLPQNQIVASTIAPKDYDNEIEGIATEHTSAISSMNTSTYLSLRDKINPAKVGIFNENEQKGIREG